LARDRGGPPGHGDRHERGRTRRRAPADAGRAARSPGRARERGTGRGTGRAGNRQEHRYRHRSAGGRARPGRRAVAAGTGVTAAANTGEPVESERIDGKLLAMSLVLVLGTFMASLDATIVNVGLRTLGVEFGAAVTEVQWASTAYLLAVVAAAPTSGWLAERFGARRVWLGAVALFLVGSVACALAWSTTSLAVFRVLQGLGGGLLPPTGQALLARVAGKARTGRLMSIVG